MKSKKNIYARLGLLTKALFFLCIGVVTALEAFGLGGFKAGTSTLLNVIVKEEYGRAILILFAAGLFGYVFWRVYESIVDNENYGTSLNGLAQRIAFCFGGLVYAFIALSFLGLMSYYKNNVKILFLYLFFVSIFLELCHILIPQRTFEYKDLIGNILGVFLIFILFSLYNLIKHNR